MVKRYVTSLLLLTTSVAAFAQRNTSTSKLSVAGAFDYSVVNNHKEVRGYYKPGFNGRLMFQPRSYFAFSGEFTYHFPHNTAPSLEDVRSWNADLNGHFILDVGESDLKFMAIFGLDFLNWSGTYVGPTLNDNNKYYYGMRLQQKWVAGNLGFGFNHDIGRRINGFGEFKVRFTSEGKDDLFGVADAGFNFGLRVNLLEIDHKTDDKSKAKQGSGNEHRHRKPGRMYKWLPK